MRPLNQDKAIEPFSPETDLNRYPGFAIILLLLHEDENFFRHSGISWHSMRNAIREYLLGRFSGKSSRLSGGSSITQQIARLRLNIWNRTLRRKLSELRCARKLEASFSKSTLLQEYLELVPLNPPSGFGFAHAAERYFGVHYSSISIEQCLILCYLIPAPAVRRGYFLKNTAADRFWFTRAYTKLQELFCLLYFAAGERGLRDPSAVTAAQAIELMKAFDRKTLIAIDQGVRVQIDVLAARHLLPLSDQIAQLHDSLTERNGMAQK